jgi:O-succinylbenzoate synthase
VTRNFSGKTLEEATEAAEKYMKEWMQYQQPIIEGHYKKDDVYFVTVRYTSLD